MLLFGRVWIVGLWIQGDAVSGAYWAIFVEAWKRVMLRVIWSVGVWVKWFQRGGILVCCLKIVLGVFGEECAYYTN